jgi:single-strand DNA-binding protein
LLNKVMLIGRLTVDPDVKASPTGVYVANMRLATNTYAGKDEDGKSKKQTEFHQLVAFGKRAEFAGQYLKKGGQVYAEGRLKTSTWTDSAGQKHYRVEIILDDLKGIGSRSQAHEEAA